jgi:hypothetical protein
MSPLASSPHLTDADIDRFRRHALSGGALIRFADHLDACEPCRVRAAGADDGLTRLPVDAALGLPDVHVAEDEVHAYADGALDAGRRAEIDEHLAHCAACAAEIRDLEQFARSDRASGQRPWWYAGLAAAAVLALAAFLFGTFRAAPPAQLAVLDDGAARLTVDAQGNVNPSDGLSAEESVRVRRALASGRLDLPAAVLMLGGLDTQRLRGPAAGTAFRVESPLGTAVLSDTPLMRWRPLADHATYVVRLHDETSGATVTSPPLHDTAWTPVAPLSRGDVYVWQVEASAAGEEHTAPQPPAPAARFVVLEAPTASRLAHAPASHLLRGILYANAGVLDDAEREFAALRSRNPSSVLAQQLADQLAHARRPTSLEKP